MAHYAGEPGLPAWGDSVDAQLASYGDSLALLSVAHKTAVNIKDYGAACNGVADDAPAMRTAAAAAIAAGVPLMFPASGTVAIGSRVNLPAGLVLFANGATVVGLSAAGDFLLAFAGSTFVYGVLNVQTAASTNVRGVVITGAQVSINDLRVSAPSPGAGVGDTYDLGVRIDASADVRIRSLTITNFDYPCAIVSSTRVRIGYVSCTSYVRGIYVSDTIDLWVDGGVLKTASPNAAINPGHNGVLIDTTANDGTMDLHFSNVSVRDAGEHGWRIGGSKRVRRVWFNDCEAINVGGCGFKVLGGAIVDNNYHEDIFFNSPLVEDAGQTASNAAGVQIEFVRRVKVTDLSVRRNVKTYAAGHGVEIQAAENVTVSNPTISDTLTACYGVGMVLGNCTNVRLAGGLMSSATGDGINIDYSGRTFRRVSVEGFPQVDISGSGYSVNIVNSSGGTVVGGAWLTWQSAQPAANQSAGVLSDWFCEVRASFTGTPAFKNGSRWLDSATGVQRAKDTTWKVPVLA